MSKTIVDGVCRFCGQIQHVEVEANSNDQTIIEAATMLCRCEDAHTYQMITKGQKKINELFGEDYPDAAEVLKLAVNSVVGGTVAKVVIDTGADIKGQITLKTTGLNIKRIEKTQKESNVK